MPLAVWLCNVPLRFLPGASWPLTATLGVGPKKCCFMDEEGDLGFPGPQETGCHRGRVAPSGPPCSAGPSRPALVSSRSLLLASLEALPRAPVKQFRHRGQQPSRPRRGWPARYFQCPRSWETFLDDISAEGASRSCLPWSALPAQRRLLSPCPRKSHRQPNQQQCS